MVGIPADSDRETVVWVRSPLEGRSKEPVRTRSVWYGVALLAARLTS